jgi:aryl-alcohol dehydrogenase-like predicted oxidoreductase
MITPIGFGAWTVGGPWQFGWGEQSDHDSIAAIHRALELGVNWIDTAAIYGLGHSEEAVAKALRAPKSIASRKHHGFALAFAHSRKRLRGVPNQGRHVGQDRC